MRSQRVRHDWVTKHSTAQRKKNRCFFANCRHFNVYSHILSYCYRDRAQERWKDETFWEITISVQFSSVTQLCPTLRLHGFQHTRTPCPSPTPGVYLNSHPLSWWCYPIISSSVIPFSSHCQSFPASVSFQMSQLFASGGQSIGVSASTSVLPMNIQDWPPLGWTGWISLPVYSPFWTEPSSYLRENTQTGIYMTGFLNSIRKMQLKPYICKVMSAYLSSTHIFKIIREISKVYSKWKIHFNLKRTIWYIGLWEFKPFSQWSTKKILLEYLIK